MTADAQPTPPAPPMSRPQQIMLALVLGSALLGIALAWFRPLWLNPAGSESPGPMFTSIQLYVALPLIWLLLLIVARALKPLRFRVGGLMFAVLIVCFVLTVVVAGRNGVQAALVTVTSYTCGEAGNETLGDPAYTQWVCRAAIIGDSASVFVFEGDSSATFVRLLEQTTCTDTDCSRYS